METSKGWIHNLHYITFSTNMNEKLLKASTLHSKSSLKKKTWKKPYGGRILKPLCLLVILSSKICYGELLLKLPWPSESRLTTPFSRQNSNGLRFRCSCTATARAPSTCLHKKWLRSFLQRKTRNFILLLYDISLINDDVLILECSS